MDLERWKNDFKYKLSLIILYLGLALGMHNEGVPLHSNVMSILVAAQCY